MKIDFFESAENQQDGEEGKKGLGRTLGEWQPVSCQACWSRRGRGSQFLGAHGAHSIVFSGQFLCSLDSCSPAEVGWTLSQLPSMRSLELPLP